MSLRGAWVTGPSPVRAWATAFVGLLLLQAVWILVVPPFQGVDEHDHAFKAAAVARGDWSASHPSVAVGRGELVAVPRDIVEAAHPACERLPYTARDDCNASSATADDRVLVGSASARYNPVFYAVVGSVALPFDGNAADSAMRWATAAWCAALMALALAVVGRRARTAWPRVAVLAALTPTMMYTTAIAAPNGPEMAAGLLLWCVLVAAARDSAPAPRWVVVAGTLAAVHLAVLRSLGPLWLTLILLTAAVAWGVPRFLRAAGTRRLRLPLGIGGLAVLVGVGWTLTAGANDPASESGSRFPGDPWGGMLSNWIVWCLQQVAAVPSRNDMAPLLVYATTFALWAGLLLLALRWASRGERRAILAVFVLVSAVSVLATLASYSRLGYAWQGRYAWPYVVGWLLLAGGTLDRSGHISTWARPAAVIVAGTTAVAGVVTAIDAAHSFARTSPYAGAGWSAPPSLLLCVLAATGMALLLAPLRQPAALTIASEPRQAGGRTLIG